MKFGMGARWLLNLLLLCIVGALAALAYFRPGLELSVAASTLSQQLPEQVQQLQIERPEHAPITLVRSVDGWQLSAPIQLPANPFRIEPLLQLRRAVSRSNFPAVADALHQYGLAEPEVWLMLDGERYAFGAVEPLNGYRYVRVGGVVHLITDRIHHYLLMSPYDFVSLQLLPPRGELVAVRSGLRLIDDELVLGGWREAQARRVSAYREPQEGVETLHLVMSDGVQLQVDILRREPEFILGVSARGVRYHFTEEVGERLLQMMADDA